MAKATESRQVVRIPLVGVPTARIVTDLSTASGVIGVGVIGNMIIGNVATSSKDQQFVNVIFDKIKNPVTGAETLFTMKRPGFTAHETVSGGAIGSVVRVWSSQGAGTKVISAFGSPNSAIADGTTNKGSITGIAKFIDEAQVGSTPTLLIVSSDQSAWYYQDGGAPTEITDADFPTNITGRFVSLDGYNFIMGTDGKIWNSDLNSISAWTATSFLTAQMYPDFGIGLARYKNMIVAFGKETVEFFQISDNTTGTGSPLIRSEQAFIRQGCASQIGYIQVEDSVAWVSSSDRGGCSIYMLDNFSPRKISTSIIDSQLALAGPANIKLNCIKLVGKTLIFAQSNNLTFVYSVEDDIWCQWSSTVPLWTDMSSGAGGAAWQIFAVSDLTTSGKVYTISPSSFVYQDDGLSYSMIIQTSKLDFNTNNRKFYHKLTLIGDESTTDSTISIAWSDDDYQSFTTPRTVNMADSRAVLTQLGAARRRSYKITHSANTPVRLEAIELVLTIGNT